MNDATNIHQTTEIKLKNGTSEMSVLVGVVMLSIRRLFDSAALPEVLALYDLASGAHDSKYDISYSRKLLAELGLLQPDGRMHSSVRNIAASALSVDGDRVMLTNPAA